MASKALKKRKTSVSSNTSNMLSSRKEIRFVQAHRPTYVRHLLERANCGQEIDQTEIRTMKRELKKDPVYKVLDKVPSGRNETNLKLG